MAPPERALSIQQPYAHLIMSGQLFHTRRARSTNYRGRVYVYAGSKLAKDERYPLNPALKYPTGSVLGTVDIVACEEGEDGEEGFRWLLANAQPYPIPRKVSNSPQPMFWTPEFEDE